MELMAKRSFVVLSAVSAALVAAAVVAGVLARSRSRAPAPLRQAPAPPGPPSSAPATDPRAAVEALEKEALDAVRRLVEALPGKTGPLVLLGTVHVEFGNTAEGVRCWERSLELAPGSPEVLDGLAGVANAKGEHARAAELWSRLLQSNPGMPGIRNKIANAMIESGRLDEAVAVLEKAHAGSPGERGESCFLLGKAYLQQRNYEKARESYRAALAVRPGNGSAWFGLATAEARLGLHESSRQSMAKYRALLKESMAFRTGRMAGRKADGSRGNAQRDLAAAQWRAARAHTGAAAVYRAHKRLARAEAHWQRAAELDPGNTRCRMALAALYRSDGRRDKAAVVLGQLVKIDPANANVHANLGILYAEIGRLDDALAAARRAMELDPKSPKIRAIHREILTRKQGDGPK
jgi:tetratricopeptide (TPR) repeat protein